ncbi:MAG: MerR family transcriptional regulator [Proteobacteria bacterium]|nr:MAG: MerR family transcriptional regulator [Pseudomonadota bacterium]QKK12128.1 MAG: MerR family transcriptional regulator [Pseudomonadota bacterium]
MKKQTVSLLTGEVLEEEVELTLGELCRICQVPAEQVFALVEEGVAEPLGRDPARWRFRGITVRRVRCAIHLQRDLGVNVAGAALALDLLEELEAMRARLRRFDV